MFASVRVYACGMCIFACACGCSYVHGFCDLCVGQCHVGAGAYIPAFVSVVTIRVCVGAS